MGYIIRGGNEQNLPAPLLFARTDMVARRASSSSSSAAAVSFGEWRVIDENQELTRKVGVLEKRIRVEQWQANGDLQQATALHNFPTPMPIELNTPHRAILEMFHAVKPPDLLKCVSDFNPDYRCPRTYVDGRLKFGKPRFHTADEVTEEMS